MSDQAPEPAEEKPLGRLLAEERERQGLSRVEAAQRLHMSAYQIEALEIGDYARLPQGTFLRGFVRNYSKVLGLDPEAMLSRLAQSSPRMATPEIVVPSQNIRFDPLGQRFANPYVKAAALWFVAVALSGAALYWWVYIRPDPPATARKPTPESGPPQQIAAAPVPAPELVTPVPAPVIAETPKPEPAKPEPARTQAAKAPPRPEPVKNEPPKREATPREAARGEGGVIRFRFRGESWVEIRDGQGKVLLSRLNARGTEAEVSGRPPFSVIVGNAPQVDMVYNDREFPLEPHTKVAVARFTIE